MTDEQLPPLPEPDISYEAARDDCSERYAFSDDALREFARAAVLMERERMAAWLDRDWLCDTVEERDHRHYVAEAIRKGE